HSLSSQSTSSSQAPKQRRREGESRRQWRNRTRTRSSVGGRLRRTAGSWRSCACTTSPPPSARPPPGPSPTPSPGRSVRSSPFFFLASGQSSISFLPVPVYRAGPVSQKRKAPEPGQLRRSGRVTGLPEQPSYLEGAGQRDYRGVYEAYAVWKGPTDEERAGALAKAEELQRRIHRIRCPAFVKPMTHSLAMNAVQMLIPKDFLKYLPAHDEAVVVVDEADDEFHMMYNAHRQGRHYYFHKGWRGFAAHHDLAVGDCLVFHMTERAKFKVYIFRANPDYESDQTSDDSEDEE
uniref:TF-B3 domain-containing protein n=2 Tax=Aegilops tauschii subsp. strangulata TaxID=200361 RepID=A0A453ME68_AEGTS